MSDTIKIKVYTYPELNEEAKEKVRIWLDDWQFEDWDREWWTEELEKLDYEDIDISYSGFWSQGDGASIQCSVNLESFILRNKLGKEYQSLLYWLRRAKDDCGYINGVKIKREHWGHYVHEMLLSENINDLLDDLTYSLGDKPEEYTNQVLSSVILICKDVLEEVREKSRELYRWLESDYEYHQTDEYLSEMCEANEYRFDEYGNPVHHLEIA